MRRAPTRRSGGTTATTGAGGATRAGGPLAPTGIVPSARSTDRPDGCWPSPTGLPRTPCNYDGFCRLHRGC
eukprot:9546451-Lingulodinium_polyedra.AAC.1